MGEEHYQFAALPLSGSDSGFLSGQSVPSAGQTTEVTGGNSLTAVQQVGLPADLHAGARPDGVYVQSSLVCLVPYQTPAKGDLVKMGQMSRVSGQSDSAEPRNQRVPDLVASFPASSVGEILSPSVLDGGHNRCQSVRVGRRPELGSGSLGESRLPINILELRAIRLVLDHWSDQLQGFQTMPRRWPMSTTREEQGVC